jgi:hypothetical protein
MWWAGQVIPGRIFSPPFTYHRPSTRAGYCAHCIYLPPTRENIHLFIIDTIILLLLRHLLVKSTIICHLTAYFLCLFEQFSQFYLLFWLNFKTDNLICQFNPFFRNQIENGNHKFINIQASRHSFINIWSLLNSMILVTLKHWITKSGITTVRPLYLISSPSYSNNQRVLTLSLLSSIFLPSSLIKMQLVRASQNHKSNWPDVCHPIWETDNC